MKNVTPYRGRHYGTLTTGTILRTDSHGGIVPRVRRSKKERLAIRRLALAQEVEADITKTLEKKQK